MLKFNTVIAFLLLCCYTGFAQKKSHFKIEGKLTGFPEGFLVKLYDLSSGTNILIDSTQLKSGKFSFRGEIPDGFQHLAIMDIRKGEKGYTFDYRKFWVDLKPLKFEGVQGKLEDAKLSGNILNQHESQIIKEFTERPDEKVKIVQDFIKKNPKSIIGLYYLDVMSGNMEKETLKQCFDYFEVNLKNSPFGQKISAMLNSNVKPINIGDIAPDFTLPNKLGRAVSLSEYRGKYVLLDFWGSWCAPCRAQNKELVKLYESFKDKNFDILGISIEGSREHWLISMKQDGIVWESLSDLKTDNTLPVILFGVNSYPSNFLISPDGVILAQNIHGEELQAKLKELLD